MEMVGVSFCPGHHTQVTKQLKTWGRENLGDFWMTLLLQHLIVFVEFSQWPSW